MDFLPNFKKKKEYKDIEWEKSQIEKAKRDPKAFSPLYKKYYERIYLYIKKKVRKKEIAEDVTAQTFEKAMKSLKKFQWQGIALSSWLYRIARNSLNDYFRSLQKQNIDGMSQERIEQTEDENSLSNIDSLIKDEKQDEVLQAIAQLKEIDQMIVYYKFFENMSNKKIAEELDISETNVGTRIYRLKEELRVHLQKK